MRKYAGRNNGNRKDVVTGDLYGGEAEDLISRMRDLPVAARKKVLKKAHRSTRRDENRQRQHQNEFDDTPNVSLQIKIPMIRAKNEKQHEYISALRAEAYSLFLAYGIWGSGKTKVATHVALEKFFDKDHPCEKIVIARPSISGENEIGFEPGTKDEKLAGWCKPILVEISKLVGSQVCQALIKMEHIELLNIDQLKGRTFENAFVIIDEAEDLSFDTLKNLVARHGENNITVICGDRRQTDRSKKTSVTGFGEIHGFDAFIRTIEDFVETGFDAFLVEFTDWETECVRSALARDFGKRLEACGRL